MKEYTYNNLLDIIDEDLLNMELAAEEMAKETCGDFEAGVLTGLTDALAQVRARVYEYEQAMSARNKQ